MIAVDRLVAVTMAASPVERVEPITLALTKKHLRVNLDSASEDDLIRGQIAAARGFLEEYAGRQTIDAIYEYTVVPVGRVIEVARPPMREVLSVVSVDGDSGLETALDPSEYRVRFSGVPVGSPPSFVCDPYCPPGAIELVSGTIWPGAALRITRVCGYGRTPEEMPPLIQSALYMLVGHFYRNRAEVTAESLMQLPMGADLLLKGLKYDALVVTR